MGNAYHYYQKEKEEEEEEDSKWTGIKIVIIVLGAIDDFINFAVTY